MKTERYCSACNKYRPADGFVSVLGSKRSVCANCNPKRIVREWLKPDGRKVKLTYAKAKAHTERYRAKVRAQLTPDQLATRIIRSLGGKP